jgi:hypothetical protein
MMERVSLPGAIASAICQFRGVGPTDYRRAAAFSTLLLL